MRSSILYLLPALAWLITLPLFMTSVDMWFGSLAVTLFLFLTAQYVVRRQARINNVVTTYLNNCNPGDDENGLPLLLKCGVVELKNRCELNEAFRRIVSNGKKHPDYYKDIPNKNLLSYLKFCHKNGFDIEGNNSLVAICKFKKIA